MLFIYLFFLLMLAAAFLVYLAHKRLHYTYTSSNSIINANLYGHESPSSCLHANILRSCTNDDQCSPSKCHLTPTQASNTTLTCRPYLNAAKACASMDSCDSTFCDVTYNEKTNQRNCVPRSFCQLPEPIEICNERNGGQWELTGMSEGTGDNAAESSSTLYQCTCKYPGIAAGKGCELNPDVCDGGDWIYHAKDECEDQVDETNCLYRASWSPTEAAAYGIQNYNQLPPSSPYLRKSCTWIPIDGMPGSRGTCIQRDPDPTTDCLCPPSTYLLIKDQGAIGKQNVPICVPKNKNTCSNQAMCSNFYSNTVFPITPSQNYKSTLPAVPYLVPRRPPSQFIYSAEACENPDNYVSYALVGLGTGTQNHKYSGGMARRENTSTLETVCNENIGVCAFSNSTISTNVLKKMQQNCNCALSDGAADQSVNINTDPSMYKACNTICSPTFKLIVSADGALINVDPEELTDFSAAVDILPSFDEGLTVKNATTCNNQPGLTYSTWIPRGTQSEEEFVSKIGTNYVSSNAANPASLVNEGVLIDTDLARSDAVLAALGGN